MTNHEHAEDALTELWSLVEAYAGCRVDCDRSRGEVSKQYLALARSNLRDALTALSAPAAKAPEEEVLTDFSCESGNGYTLQRRAGVLEVWHEGSLAMAVGDNRARRPAPAAVCRFCHGSGSDHDGEREAPCDFCNEWPPRQVPAPEGDAHLSICSSQDDTMESYPKCDCGAPEGDAKAKDALREALDKAIQALPYRVFTPSEVRSLFDAALADAGGAR